MSAAAFNSSFNNPGTGHDGGSFKPSSGGAAHKENSQKRSTQISWRQNLYHGTVICSVEVPASPGNVKSSRFNLRRDQIQLYSFDTIAPNGAFVRVLTCSLRELLSQLPNNLHMNDVVIKRFPDCSENVGSAVNILGRTDIMVQVYASSEVERVYNCAISVIEPNQNIKPVQQQPQQQQAYQQQQPYPSYIPPPHQQQQQQQQYMQPQQQAYNPGFQHQPVSDFQKISEQQYPPQSYSSPQPQSNYQQPPPQQQQQQQQQPPAAAEPHFNFTPGQNDNLLEGLSVGDEEEWVVEEDQGGTRALSHKPWAGAIVAPTNGDNLGKKCELPDEELVLEHVYGYRTRDCRNNLFYLGNGNVVFPAGSVVVIHDIQKNSQRFFYGKHKEDVTAIAVHPDGKTVASGDIVTHDDGCYVFIWDSDNIDDDSKIIKLRIGEKKLGRGVADVEFSPDGRFLTVVAMDDDHKIYIYDWQKNNKPLAWAKGHNDQIFGVTFNTSNTNEFVTYGVKHLKYWTFDEANKKLKGDKGVFGSRKVSSVLCAVFLPDGSYITGGHGGELIAWRGNQIMTAFDDAHKGAVFGLTFHDSMGIISGGRDGRVTCRDNKMQVTDECQVEAGVRASCIMDNGKKLIVGLEDSTIVEIEGMGSDAENKQFKVLDAHTAYRMEELWGLCVHPVKEDEFATCGDDNRVFRWDAANRKVLCETTLENKLRAIGYSPDGTVLACGSEEGDLFVLQAEDLSQVYCKKYTKRKGIRTREHGINVVKFSPNGQYLAVGSSDMVVDVYDVAAGMKLVSTCKGHSSFISHLDWSEDSCSIRTNSGDYELLFWHAPTGKHITSASSMRDTKWATHTCILGWGLQGIWEKGMDGTDVNWVDRNPAGTCLASGDDFLNVRLHSYPAVKEGMPCKKFTGHGSHVTKVAFNISGKRLFSAGGMDGCAFQWIVKKEEEN